MTYRMGDLSGTVRVAAQQKKAPPECANTRGAGTSLPLSPGGTVMERTLPLSTAEHLPSPQIRAGLLQPLHVSDCIAELIRDLERRVQEGA